MCWDAEEGPGPSFQLSSGLDHEVGGVGGLFVGYADYVVSGGWLSRDLPPVHLQSCLI